MDQSVLDALDNYRLRMVKEGSELLKDIIGETQRSIVESCLSEMANKINNDAQRKLAYKLIKGGV